MVKEKEEKKKRVIERKDLVVKDATNRWVIQVVKAKKKKTERKTRGIVCLSELRDKNKAKKKKKVN